MATFSLASAQRIALAAQGMDERRPKRADRRHFAKTLGRLGLAQLDSVNVCARAHYMPFFSRLGSYDSEALDSWLSEAGRHFEYWCHAAAVVPVERYRLWDWKMRAAPHSQRAREIERKHPGLEKDVLRQLHERGPLTISELSAPKARSGPWWGHGPGKIVLESLLHRGKVSALRTGNFQRRYDLIERMIPATEREAALDEEAAHRQLLLLAARHLGIGTADDIIDYYRLNKPRSRPLLDVLASEGHLERCQVEGWSMPCYLHPEAKRPRKLSGRSLLSPFDPLVWYRPRVERLFGFHYRIEIYVPAPQRVHGYYVLPFLLDGELVARVDLKAARKESELVVQAAFLEEGRDRDRVARELRGELEEMASWLGLAKIRVRRKGNLRL